MNGGSAAVLGISFLAGYSQIILVNQYRDSILEDKTLKNEP